MISELMAEQAAEVNTVQAVFMNLLPFILIFVIFYFLLIRPQRKKQAQHQQMVSSLKVGDNIVSSSGIKGKITKLIDDTAVTVEIAKGVEVDMLRTHIAAVEQK